MTEEEIAPFIEFPVRVTLADGRVLAGTLHRGEGESQRNTRYVLVSDALREGDPPVSAAIESAAVITDIEDAAADAAAVE